MRIATKKEIDSFIQYRANHVALVQRIGSVVFGIDISDHDKDKIEANGEELNLFSLRNSMLNGTYHPHKADKAKLKRLVGKHVKSQKHHPEYWDDSITPRNFDDNNPPQVNAHKMPKRYLLEMCCDWSAVALKLNKPIFSWYNKTCIGENARFLFTDNQKDYIVECLSRIQSKIDSEKLYYPNVTYNTEQVSPKIDFGKKLTESKEDMIYSNEFKEWFGDWENDPENSSKVVDENGKPLIMYHGTFQHFDTFDPSMGREATDIQGIYLTPDMEEASFYGNNVRAFYVNMRNPADSDEAFNIWHKYYIQGDRKAGVKARKDLQSMGYDGIMGDYDLEPDSEYVVFSANQVKSIDNNGNFSKESDNIYEKILHKNSKWVVTDHTGEKNLGTYDTKEEAEKRLKQVEYFKHINENEEKGIDNSSSSDIESTTVNEKVITSFGGKVPISSKDKDQIQKFCKKAVEDGMKPTKYTEEEMGGIANSSNFSSSSIASNTPENPIKVTNLGEEKLEEAYVVCSLDGQVVDGTYTTDLAKAKTMRQELADEYHTFFKLMTVQDKEEPMEEALEKKKTCVFTFGRYQPPTKGHLRVWEKVANTEGDAHYIYTSHTKDKKRNPLDYNTKIGLIKSALKEHNINAEMIDSEAKTIIDVVVDIASKGYNNLIFVGGSDRLDDMVSLIRKYNDKPNAEGNSYHFDSIEGVSAGERDPDSDNVEGISGTKLRQMAIDGDFEGFKNNLAFSDEPTIKEVMKLIQNI